VQLFEYSFYQNIFRALKDDGLMVCQSQSPVFHLEILKKTFGHIRSLFPVAKLYTATVPTYPGGLWSFTLGAKKDVDLRQAAFSAKDTKYVNGEILESCFRLPQFVREQLGLNE
jgi:spermidine synthase